MAVRRVAAFVVALATTATLAGCTGAQRRPAPTPAASTAQRHTSDTATTAGGSATSGPCTAPSMTALVTRFVAAFNAGDGPLLTSLWGPPGQGFMWYTVGPPMPGQITYQNRSPLLGYFLARHAHHERLRLTSFQYNGIAGDYGNFQYTLIRQADGLPPTAYGGKGAAYCQPPSPGRLFVWSMAAATNDTGTPTR